MTIAQAYDKFIRDRKIYCAAETIRTYNEHIRVFFRYLEENYQPVTALSFESIPDEVNIFSDFIIYLREKGTVKNVTIRSYCRTVKAFLKYCYEEDICRDYLKRVKMPKDDSIPPAPLVQNEVALLDSCFDLASLQGLRNYCIIHLMLDCGLRSQEVIHLDLKDLDAAHNILHIRVSKECKSRITMIPDFLSEHIRKYMELDGRSSGRIFFCLRNQEPITENTIKQLFKKLKKKSGIERLHAHLLRHTFATSFLIGGGNLEFLRVMMGHSDYVVTKMYSSLAAQYRMLGIPVYKLDPIFFRMRGYD